MSDQTAIVTFNSDLPITYNVTPEQIEAKRAAYAALTCDTPKGYEETRLAIADCRDTRVGIEARRKELKEGALKWGKLVDAKAKELTAIVESLEEPLKAKKAAVDEAKALARAAKEAAEKAALEAQIKAEQEAEEKRLAEIAAAQKAEADRLAAERRAFEAEQARAKAAAEKAAAESRAKAEEEARKLAAARAEVERQRQETERLEAERLAKLEADRQAELARVAAEEARVREAERQAAIRARLDALRPDAEKLYSYAGRIRAIDVPTVASEEARRAVTEAIDALAQIAGRLEAFGRVDAAAQDASE